MVVSAGRPLVVVTGAHGFIGHALCRDLAANGYAVRAVVRAPAAHRPTDREEVALGNLEDAPEPRLAQAFEGALAVVHLAGRAHVLRERRGAGDALYTAANEVATQRVASAAVSARVPRVMFASTVKVNGEVTQPSRPFRPDDAPAPQDAYARSKLRGEQALLAACARSDAVPVIVRLPLVYGPGVRGNFAALLDAIAAEQRLPLGAIDNRRSLLYVGNLTEAMRALLACATAPSGVHFVADAESVSTRELAVAIGTALRTPARLWSVPVALLRMTGALTGRGAMIDRLASSLEVDTTSFTTLTAWRPRHTLAQGLAATAAWWRARHSI